jgi:cytochrome c oxidase cbb3-type subunit 3
MVGHYGPGLDKSWGHGGLVVRVLIGCLLAAMGASVNAAQPATFPAQQRPAGDPALIERGKALYGLTCRACHGVDLRGGDLGGPNLLRSQLVLNDQSGEAIGPVIRAGRTPPSGTPMPPQQMSDEDVRATAAYLHSVIATSQGQGAPPPGPRVELNLLVGNAREGEAYFRTDCASCHSPTGDLAGIATRITSIEQLQNSWVAGRRMGAPAANASPKPARVTVKFAGGTSLAGTLVRMDDFVIALRTDAGDYRSFTRRSASPRIESIAVDDPLAKHRAQWTKLTDKTLHDVTAYLATLK